MTWALIPVDHILEPRIYSYSAGIWGQVRNNLHCAVMTKLEPWSKSYRKVYAVVILDLGSSDRLATVSEKCIHSVAWPNLSPGPVYRQDIDSQINWCLLDKQDLGSSDGVLVCYQKEHSLVRLTKLEPWSHSQKPWLWDLGSSYRTEFKRVVTSPRWFGQKGIMKRINHNDLTHYFIAIYDKKVRQLPISYIKSCNKFIEENSIAAQIYRSTPIREWRKARKDFEENGYPWLKIKK